MRTLLFLPLLVQAERLHTQSFSPEIKRTYKTHHQTSQKNHGRSTDSQLQQATINTQDQAAENYFQSLGIEYQIKNQYSTQHNGMRHAHGVQTVNGISIANTAIGVTISREGNIITSYNSVWEQQTENGGDDDDQIVFTAASANLIAAPSLDEHEISAEEALTKLAKSIGLSASADMFQSEMKHSLRGDEPSFVLTQVHFTVNNKVPAKKTYVATPEHKSGLAVSWELEVQMDENWFLAHVDAKTGNILSRIDWHADSGYVALPPGTNDPSEAEQTWLEAPAHLPSSPLGWHSTHHKNFTTTKGNNVVAIENLKGGYFVSTAQGSVDGGPDLLFNTTYDHGSEPKSSIDAAVVQLFVTCNWIHDVFYAYEFNEVSGNFQEYNFGKGGKGGDSVIAQAQDGSGTNNANFATPPDGRSGKMRMYVWTQTHPSRDGDLEAGIVIHEYAHGISTRLTGGPENSGCLGHGESGGMGEGWGDILATILRMKGHETKDSSFGMGNWVNAGNGIRPYDYSTNFTTNPQTYGYLKKAAYYGVHAKGAVWATILYDVYWVFMEDDKWSPDWYSPASGGNTKFMQVLVDGLKLQPCMPSFVDARDAILAAEKENVTAGKLHCKIWKAFAARGLGEKAKAGRKVVEDFTVPEACRA